MIPIAIGMWLTDECCSWLFSLRPSANHQLSSFLTELLPLGYSFGVSKFYLYTRILLSASYPTLLSFLFPLMIKRPRYEKIFSPTSDCTVRYSCHRPKGKV